MATVGKNILDNLTTGMYSDSKVIYREYIQNACDQIDKAIEYGLLDDGDGCIEITIDQRNRNILIYDNAMRIVIKSSVKIKDSEELDACAVLPTVKHLNSLHQQKENLFLQ